MLAAVATSGANGGVRATFAPASALPINRLTLPTVRGMDQAMKTLRLLLQVLLHPDLRQVLFYRDQKEGCLSISRAAALGFVRAPDGRLHASLSAFHAEVRGHNRVR